MPTFKPHNDDAEIICLDSGTTFYNKEDRFETCFKDCPRTGANPIKIFTPQDKFTNLKQCANINFHGSNVKTLHPNILIGLSSS